MAIIKRPSLVNVKQVTSGCSVCGGNRKTVVTQTPQQIQVQAAKIEPIIEKVVEAPTPEISAACGATLTQWRTMTPAALKAVTSRECVAQHLLFHGIQFDADAKDVQLIKLLKQSL